MLKKWTGSHLWQADVSPSEAYTVNFGISLGQEQLEMQDKICHHYAGCLAYDAFWSNWRYNVRSSVGYVNLLNVQCEIYGIDLMKMKQNILSPPEEIIDIIAEDWSFGKDSIPANHRQI